VHGGSLATFKEPRIFNYIFNYLKRLIFSCFMTNYAGSRKFVKHNQVRMYKH